MAIRRLLVANRGEIAVRIFRTCRRLGIDTVAIAAPDDAAALHTRSAGHTERVSSYLDPGAVIRAALDCGADAVHPGYGFLAENAELAAAVQAADLLWIGPSPEAIRRAGDKLEAKRLAASAGVPTLPTGSATEVGFPLLVKAAAGGGGHGMRIVRTEAELAGALEDASREAKAAFRDGTVFLERYLDRPRHIEIQLLADRGGRVISLGERECSIQRRYQKTLEESPAPGLADGLRARIAAAAVAVAEAVGYENAGTAEFLVQDEDFYFLELNARIQVEHPVTEAVTGLDLVEWQLRLAQGAEAPEPPQPAGHAIEVRLYAEHPRTFAPQSGRISSLVLPETIRVDSGVESGDEIPLRYDPLIAKLIAHAPTRELALRALADALARTAVRGVTTNLSFLRWLIDHPVIRSGETSTTFLAERPPLSRHAEPGRTYRGYFRVNRDPSLPAPAYAPPPQLEASGARGSSHDDHVSTVSAPTPGAVIRVLVRVGEHVHSRQPLLVLEAMKMQTSLLAPYDAVVAAVHTAEGDQVAAGARLLELAADGVPDSMSPGGQR